MARNLLLMGTTACDLCDQAEAVVLAVFAANPGLEQHVHVEVADVISSGVWVENYGPRIPVLLDGASGRELAWPFDPPALVEFINRCMECP